MARSGKRVTPGKATTPAADVAIAIDKERLRLERQLATGLRTLATRLDQLVTAEESKGRKAIAKRRRQADVAAAKVAELTDKLAILAGSTVDAATSAPVAAVKAVKAVGAATARAAKPVADVAGTAAKAAGTAAGTAAKSAGTAAKSAGSAAGTAAKSVGSAAKAAGAATTRAAGSATRTRKTPDAGPDGAP